MNEHSTNCWIALCVTLVVLAVAWKLHLGDVQSAFVHARQAELDAKAAAQKEENQHALRLECMKLNRVWQADLCLPSPTGEK